MAGQSYGEVSFRLLERQPARRTLSGVLDDSVIAAGRWRSHPRMTDQKAYDLGKRRLGYLAGLTLATCLAVGSAFVVHESNEQAKDYLHKIEACATALSGHEVDITRNQVTGLLEMAEADFSVVRACQSALGDIPHASSILDRE